MHTDGPCAQCTSEGCGMYRWAAARLERWEAEHGRRYPAQESLRAPLSGQGLTRTEAKGRMDG